jgi:nucleoside-diphosphate kinase
MGSEDKTFVMVKPDGVRRGLVGSIIKRFEDKGLQLCGLKMMVAGDHLLQKHYVELKEMPFFSALLAYVASGPVVCMCWRGEDAPHSARAIIGATDPFDAGAGTIRGDFGLVPGRNVVHGSDSPASASREIAVWFSEGELVDWRRQERRCSATGINYPDIVRSSCTWLTIKQVLLFDFVDIGVLGFVLIVVHLLLGLIVVVSFSTEDLSSVFAGFDPCNLFLSSFTCWCSKETLGLMISSQ